MPDASKIFSALLGDSLVGFKTLLALIFLLLGAIAFNVSQRPRSGFYKYCVRKCYPYIVWKYPPQDPCVCDISKEQPR